jgi:hypothetical protein
MLTRFAVTPPAVPLSPLTFRSLQPTSAMHQIFAHRTPSKTTLLHDLPPRGDTESTTSAANGFCSGARPAGNKEVAMTVMTGKRFLI